MLPCGINVPPALHATHQRLALWPLTRLASLSVNRVGAQPSPSSRPIHLHAVVTSAPRLVVPQVQQTGEDGEEQDVDAEHETKHHLGGDRRRHLGRHSLQNCRMILVLVVILFSCFSDTFQLLPRARQMSNWGNKSEFSL